MVETHTGLGERYRTGAAVSNPVFDDGSDTGVYCGGRAGGGQTLFWMEVKTMNWLSTVGQWWLAHWQIYLGFGVVYATWLGTCRWRIESTLKLAYGGGISPECHWIFRIFFPLYFILADDVEDDFPVWTLLWGKKSGDWRRWLAWPMTIAFAPIQFMVFAVAWIIAFSCLLGLLCVIAYSKRLEQPHPILARK